MVSLGPLSGRSPRQIPERPRVQEGLRRREPEKVQRAPGTGGARFVCSDRARSIRPPALTRSLDPSALTPSEPTSGFRIIIPITPFGMPEYDGGERFDLRLPYVDNGWVDEDADPMKQFRRFIGLDKKKSEDEGKKKK